jgi:hypothetical protein
MKGDIYYLKDRDGRISHKFVVEDDDFRLIGECYEACSWELDGTPYQYSYVAGVHCKWDACTHWYFSGEDYESEEIEEPDSYYHLCGGYSFIGHITAMCFVWKLAEQIISESNWAKTKKLSGCIHDEYYDHERIKQLIDLVLNGYEIVKGE